MTLLRTPLHDAHRDRGARWITFGGWEMPLQFTGIVDEHRAVRGSVGLFDVSHMGKILVRGEGAGDGLERLSTNTLSRTPNRARYTHILDEEGRILDDVIITCLEGDRYLVVCNAAPRPRILSWILNHAPDLDVDDLTEDHLCLALQGPKAARILQMVTSVDLDGLRAFRGAYIDLLLSDRLGTARPAPSETMGGDPLAPPEGPPGDACLATRTGYTGEDGFELFPRKELGSALWTALLTAGSTAGIRPIGLGARDTLRLEKGYLLSGVDFDGRQTSLETSSENLVKWDHDFIGREALRLQKERGGYDRLKGLRASDPGIPRHGCIVVRNGDAVGTVTSGTFSPSLNVGIALGYLRPELAVDGGDVAILVRDRRVRSQVVSPPFL